MARNRAEKKEEGEEQGEQTETTEETSGGEVQPVAQPSGDHIRHIDSLAEPTDDGVENLPPKPKTLKGPARARVEIWASQSKKNTIHLCNVKGCYFPLNPLRDPSRQNDPVEGIDDDGKKFMVGRCSWDKDGHGEQPMYPPKKEEEI